MRILNLYAGIGGNRLLWGDEHEVTAVEKVVQTSFEYFDDDGNPVGVRPNYPSSDSRQGRLI